MVLQHHRLNAVSISFILSTTGFNPSGRRVADGERERGAIVFMVCKPCRVSSPQPTLPRGWQTAASSPAEFSRPIRSAGNETARGCARRRRPRVAAFLSPAVFGRTHRTTAPSRRQMERAFSFFVQLHAAMMNRECFLGKLVHRLIASQSRQRNCWPSRGRRAFHLGSAGR